MENKAIKLLDDFVKWYEEVSGDDLSVYDQDTTPYSVYEFLTQSPHNNAIHTDDEERRRSA